MEHYKNLSLKDIPGEVWKPIPEYERLYEVSNKGRVKVLRINKILRQQLYSITRHHLRLNLIKNKKLKAYKVHRLVAKAFIPNPENKPMINHINGIKWDNRVENLEWCTAKENINHAFKTKLMEGSKGTKSSGVKLTIENINDIILLRSKNMTYKEIGKKFNINRKSASNICLRKAWKHLKQNEEGRWYEPE